jgi:hypothetical protein
VFIKEIMSSSRAVVFFLEATEQQRATEESQKKEKTLQRTRVSNINYANSCFSFFALSWVPLIMKFVPDADENVKITGTDDDCIRHVKVNQPLKCTFRNWIRKLGGING